MKRIGIISDTHSHWDDRYAEFFKGCHEIWHAGDVGSFSIIERLREIAPVRAVAGNCDGQDIRCEFKETCDFNIEGAHVMMRHIGGSPGHYDSAVRRIFATSGTPDLFVCGHSHILKVMFDRKNNMLFINPGAAGLQGWQTVRTLLRLEVSEGKFSNLDVLEIPRPELFPHAD